MVCQILNFGLMMAFRTERLSEQMIVLLGADLSALSIAQFCTSWNKIENYLKILNISLYLLADKHDA